MNPQFQNMMGGMGRGIPNGNMQQMNAQNTSVQLQRYIVSTLQGEGPWTGWQAEVPLQERVIQIKQLVDSLRLLGPPVELQRAVEVALNFERKEFAAQPTKEDYQRECADKLSKIRDQRQQQVQQQRLGGAQNMGMVNPNFQQQMQMRQNMAMQSQMQPGMQASPMPTPNPAMAQMQNINPGQMMNPMNQMNSMNPMAQMNQNQPNSMPQMPNPTNEPALTREDNVIINQRAAELAKGTQKDEMRNIVQRMDPRIRANLAQKGIDPIIYHFRMLATKEFRQGQAQGNNPGQAQMGNNANMNMTMMTSMANNQQNTANAAMMRNGSGSNGTPFMSNLNQFQNQQEAGLRSQQEGQTVVPASNNQNMTPEQMRIQQLLQSQQRMNQQNPAMNQNFLAQQQRMQQQQQAQQQQQQQQQQQAQRQLQSIQAQAQNQARAQAGVQGNMPNMGPQNNAMNLLNRPVNGVVPGGSPQPQRPQSRVPMPGQAPQIVNPLAQQQLQTQLMQNPQAILSTLPLNLQNFLRGKPANDWALIILRWKQSQLNQQQQQQAQQAQQAQAQQQMQRSMSQQPIQQPGHQQGPPMGNNQMLGPGPSPMQQSLSAGPTRQPNNMQTPEVRNSIPNMGQQPQQRNQSMTPNPDLMRQRQQLLQAQQQQQNQNQNQQQPQQQQPQRNLPGQQQPNNNANTKQPLTQQEMTVMDAQPILPQVLRNLQVILAQQNVNLPHARNWAELKQWLSQNPQQRVPLSSVNTLQANQFHFQVSLKQRQAANQMPNGGPMQQPQQMQPQSQPQVQQSHQPPQALQQTPQQMPAQQQQNAQINAAQAPGMGQVPQMRQITDQDLQRIRQQNPKFQATSDEQLRGFMLQRWRQQMLNNQQKGQQQQQPQNQTQSQNQKQSVVQLPNQQPQAQTQSGPTPNQPQQMQNPNRSQPVKPPAQQQSQQSAPVQQKNLKRPNQDEGTDVAANQNNTGPQPGDQSKPSAPQITREAFEKMNEADKRSYMAMMKMRHQRQELQRRIQEYSKQVQSSAPQLRPIMNMDQASRKRIMAYLTADATKNMLNRFEPFLMAYCHIENNETTIKQLLSNRNHLIAQYKPHTVTSKTWEPADNFSITAENVESIINNMSMKFSQTMSKTQNRSGQNQAQGQQNQQGQQQQASQQSLSQQAQQQLPLTAENLNLAQAQAAQQSKKGQKSKDIPPSAPIATQPPFQIGDSRGQGTPRYAPNTGIKQEDLKLDPKRRKKNPNTTTPSAMTASPDITQEHKPTPRPFKCGHVGCEYHATGFVSREELDQHTRTAHKPEPEIVTDPLAFLDNSLMQAFDLDEQMHTKKKPEPVVPTAPPMQKSLSKAGSNLKMESKPSTPIPMAKGLSQQMHKPNAPTTPNMLRTPQSIKVEAKVATPKAAEPKEEPDLWANSNFSLDTLRDTFGDMEWNDVMPTMDPEQVDFDECIQTYMQSDEWQKVMNGGVMPTSSDGSTDKSKSPGEGSEQSGAAAEAQKSNEVAKQLTEIDLSIDGINIDQDGFEDLIMTESQLQELEEGSWEKIERPSPEHKQDFGLPDPFASLEDPEMDAWNKPLYEPLQANGFPDSNSPFEPIDLEEFVAMNGPEVWAAGSMEWNAVGEPGQQIRKDLGWPVEGAQGIIR